ncbi:hypothetical protein OEZ86_005468 [Tetradesmus obliquus]|nr:hypothetical protein OEZ86_005468 [Tetradesmus obliquus]
MDEDFDDEELLLVTGRGSKAAGKKRNRKADDSEDEEERPARQQKPAPKRRAAAADSDDSESDDDGMDAEERAKLEGMNELEREMYLFEREEILQRQRERQQVLTQVRKEAEQVEVRASSRRPRTQTGTDSAIGRIAAAHAQREERQKKKQQEEEKAERSRKKRQQQDEEDEEQEEEEEAEESDASLEAEDSDELQELEAEEEEEEEEAAAAADRAAGQLGTRTEVYDEGAGSYEESEERATLDEVLSITLRRSDLEAWHGEPFFEEDVKGCLLRIVNSAEQARTGQPSYLLARISDIVTRNSYTFPAGSKASRTRKWLHMDDLSGGSVFRHQMSMVSNSAVTQAEYDKALAKAQRGHSKFITKGDVQQAQERLQHARNFKYNAVLVKQLLDRKRAAGKGTGTVAERRARLTHELNIARQEGKPEDVVMRLQDELERLEQQERQRTQQADAAIQAARAEKEGSGMGAAAAAAAAGGAKLTTEMALAVINMRNRDKNVLKIFQGVGPSTGIKKEGKEGNDVFSRRHTQSKVYWQTSKEKQEAAKAAAAEGGMQRQGSVDVTLLQGKQKTMAPSELIKVLDLKIDLDRLPPPGQVASALLPKRLLGLRWLQSVEKRQQDMAGRSLLTLDDWKRKMAYTQQMME